MACKAIALLNSLGAWRGFTAFTRINYEECVCGSLWTLYRNHWVDRHERWQRYQGVSDLGLGTFLDALKAVQAGSKQCKEKLKGWKDANKGVIEK